MKSFKLFLPVFIGIFIFSNADSQNASINILSQNSGAVKKGNTTFLEVTINNTDDISIITPYKIKAQINIPPDIATIAVEGHVLPKEWKIISNNGSTIILSNGTDSIGAYSDRTILIAIAGKKMGGPSTIIGQLSFSNGNSPGTEAGFLEDDNPADNSSTTTIKVVR